MRRLRPGRSSIGRLFFERTPIFTPLMSGKYRLLWSASACWYTARWIDRLALGWLALELTNSVWQVALITFYRNLPLLALGIFGGALGDRWGRRQIMLTAQTISVIVASSMTLLLVVNRMNFDLAVAGALLLGISTAIDWPSRRAILPETVAKKRLMNAVMLDYITSTLARAVGPLIAGVLIATAGMVWAFTALAVLHLTGLLILRRLEVNEPKPIDATSISPWKTLVDGLYYVRQTGVLFGVLMITVVLNLLVFPYQSVLPVIARDVLRTDASGLGLLTASEAIGGLLGGLTIAAIRLRGQHGWIFIGGSVTLGMLVILFATSNVYALSVGILLISGLASTGFGSMQSAIILEASSSEMRTRATGALTVAIGAGPIGALIVGQLASHIGVQLAIIACCAAGTLVAGWIAWSLPALRRH